MALLDEKTVLQYLNNPLNINLWGIIILLFLTNCSESNIEKLPFYNSADFTAEWIDKSDSKYNSIHKIADFNFINQEGQTVDNKTFKGKIYIANFFFTTCPSICPKMTSNLQKVQSAFENDDEFMMLSHSVMPWEDEVKDLKKYAFRNQIKSSKWHLVTGEKDAIYKLARESYFAEKRIGFQRSNSEFLHTENVILIDPKGRIRGVYNGTLPLEMKRLIEAIKVLKQEA